MMTNIKDEPLLLRKFKDINYFTTDEEFQSFPENKLPFLKRIVCSWKWIVLFFTMISQQFFFLSAIKSAKGKSLVLGFFLLILMTIIIWILGIKSKTAPQKKSLVFLGIIDVTYLFIVLSTAANISPIFLAALLQISILFRMFLMKFTQYHPFLLTHYLAGIIIIVSVSVNYGYNGNDYSYLLLLGILLQTTSAVFKISYLRKNIAEEIAVNKVTLLSSTVFGGAFLPLVLAMQGISIGDHLNEGFKCMVGIGCDLLPVFIFCLGISVAAHHYMLNNGKEFKEGQRVVHMMSGLLTLVGFSLSGVLFDDFSTELVEVLTGIIAAFGCSVYYFYPEVPIKFSYSN
ncbi:unnamed protein product [Blepharisma stoltei]|uniref:Uncharacterized protein n=1 Tax=Blepharisma stoltei TaxID=1481888 RepID=A0AAU9K087_9CILI|nr:unnamed protein product [Blepharisma stoltei]